MAGRRRAVSAPGSRRPAPALLASTRTVAESCVLDPAEDLGLGAVHLPELASSTAAVAPSSVVLRARCEAGLGPAMDAAPRAGRLGSGWTPSSGSSATSATRPTSSPSPRSVDLTRAMGVRVAARGSGAGSLVLHLLGVSGVDPHAPRAADGALPHPVAPGAARRRRRRRVRSPHRGLRADLRALRRRAVRVRLDDGHLPRPARHPRRRCRARPAARRGRRDRQGVPAHPGARRPGGARRPARAAGQRPRPDPRRGSGSTRSSASSSRLDGLPRHIALHPCGVLLSDSGLLDRTAGRGELPRASR